MSDPERVAYYRSLLPDPAPRKRALGLLAIDPAQIQPDVVELLGLMLNDVDPGIASSAARVLSESDLDQAAELLASALYGADDYDRAKYLATALSGMGELGFEGLKSSAKSPCTAARVWVAKCIARTKVPEALAVITELTLDDDVVKDNGTMVSAAAKRALKTNEKVAERKEP